MSRADVSLPHQESVARFGATSRTDAWYLQPLLVFLGLFAFIVYTTWAAFQGVNYFVDANGAHYLSPFYSPLLYGQAGEPYWIGPGPPSWWPSFLRFSPAFLILMGPGAMRFTCYYYRGAYYKSFWASPPTCGVGGPHGGRYTGEARFPLIMQNIHRYVFYPAAAFVIVLAYDAFRAMWFVADDGSLHFGIGVGSLVLAMNAILLGGYTFGCHCARHQIGGYLNALAGHPIRSKCYACVSSLNRGHMRWAWVSLVWVGLTDLYVRLLSMGVITDFRIF